MEWAASRVTDALEGGFPISWNVQPKYDRGTDYIINTSRRTANYFVCIQLWNLERLRKYFMHQISLNQITCKLHIFLAVVVFGLLKGTWFICTQVKVTLNICSRLTIIFDITICTNMTHPFIKFLFFEKTGELFVHTTIIPALWIQSFFTSHCHPDVQGVNHSNSEIFKAIKERKPVHF